MPVMPHVSSEEMRFICTSPAELEGMAARMLEAMGHRRVVLLYGDLGAGKTTLVAALVKSLGSPDTVSSPTFAIVHDYLLPDGGGVVHHLDAYRIENLDEAWEAGLEEILESGHWTFVEWPDVLASWLPARRAEIYLRILPDSSREIVFLIL